MLEREEVKGGLREKRLGWMMANVQAEVYQLLHCLFGFVPFLKIDF